jgi:drug/metabolite transporter superfamily protein YnfA
MEQDIYMSCSIGFIIFMIIQSYLSACTILANKLDRKQLGKYNKIMRNYGGTTKERLVMRSIKPGRGPSMMGGIGSLGAVVFGIFWTIMASSIGAPGIFTAFGVIFIIMALVSGAYNFMNATSEHRYSSFDITDDMEEPDPLNQQFAEHKEYKTPDNNAEIPGESNYCPYCGAQVQNGFEFCNKCGRKLP